jgi:hypothetical protein|eukprot:g6394.t1
MFYTYFLPDACTGSVLRREKANIGNPLLSQPITLTSRKGAISYIACKGVDKTKRPQTASSIRTRIKSSEMARKRPLSALKRSRVSHFVPVLADRETKRLDEELMEITKGIDKHLSSARLLGNALESTSKGLPSPQARKNCLSPIEKVYTGGKMEILPWTKGGHRQPSSLSPKRKGTSPPTSPISTTPENEGSGNQLSGTSFIDFSDVQGGNSSFVLDQKSREKIDSIIITHEREQEELRHSFDSIPKLDDSVSGDVLLLKRPSKKRVMELKSKEKAVALLIKKHNGDIYAAAQSLSSDPNIVLIRWMKLEQELMTLELHERHCNIRDERIKHAKAYRHSKRRQRTQINRVLRKAKEKERQRRTKRGQPGAVRKSATMRTKAKTATPLSTKLVKRKSNRPKRRTYVYGLNV